MSRPERPTALYRFYGADGAPLYFGVAVDPDQRWRGHRTTPWWPLVDHANTQIEWYPTWNLAHAAEVAAVATEHPSYNRAHAVPDPDWGTVFTSEQVRKNFSEFLGIVRFRGPVTVTRNGQRSAVVVSADLYERLRAAEQARAEAGG